MATWTIRDYDPDRDGPADGETCRHPDGDDRDTSVISGEPQGDGD